MRKDNKRDIYDVLDLLGQRDPVWKHVKMLPKFKVLYQGWAVSEVRNNKHTRQFYTIAWKRGWLPINDWIRFRIYALQ